MLRQLGSDDTLVPPNLRTIHAEGVRVTDLSSQRAPRRPTPKPSPRYVDSGWVRGLSLRRRLQLVVVQVQKILFELFIRLHSLGLAPGSLPFFSLVASPLVDPVQQPVVVRAVFRGTAQEFIVDIEALVVSFRHCAVD